ncbi:CTP:molybdopterin cytidylyltransferase MocA [Salinihabitans flavidus]|uniref:CTP:molybdopterin cytidylyltransferase MocA n=1 Tax=Salinihabitans flavidus TaxID=569882 RepID=A0A1H8RP37_9RHOB|nr:nucleotidyltransferase family protein [Salinihabitans flavidus]SEO67713.1 CTP:molybdopterin cytidylyltransferase MocA [Salinihabitans flavidus]
MQDDLAIVILAAGASSRMRGADKLLQVVAGRPLLAVMAERARAVSHRVLVALPGPDHPRAAALAGLGVTPVFVPDAAEGMGHSIRAGIAALPGGCAAAMILPADMPELTGDDLATLAAAWSGEPDRPWRATGADGTPGHPVIFPRTLFPALRGLSGDRGARDVLRAHGGTLKTFALPGRHALTDLDTPEEWAAWRRGPV